MASAYGGAGISPGPPPPSPGISSFILFQNAAVSAKRVIMSKALSPSAALPWLTADGQVQIAPKRTSTYYVTYQYMDSPSCPVGDTVVLAPLEEIVADFEVSPTWLGYDKLDLTVLDRSRNAEGRIWFIDRVEQDDSGSVLYYSISEDADSVVVGIVAFNNTCSDTAERVVPVLHHMLTFPNVFTPSLNDNNRFGPIGYNVTDYELWIYDRRGNLVFHSTDVALYDTYKRPLIDDGYRDIAEIGLQAGEHLAAVGTEIDEVAFDSGVTHGAEGIAVVQHLVLVFSLGLSRLVVNDPHAVGGVDNPVGTDYLVVPSYIALVFGRELRVEEARHLGLCHHVVEGLAEVGGSFVVGTRVLWTSASTSCTWLPRRMAVSSNWRNI